MKHIANARHVIPHLQSTQYNLNNKALEIYISGCKGPHCKGCHNPETWEFEQGYPITLDTIYHIRDKVNKSGNMIENLWILGGEPVQSDIYHFLKGLKEEINIPIWLFTRYTISQIPKHIIECCSFIKTGRYDENNLADDKIQHGIKLASRNQNVCKIGISRLW